MAGVAEPTLGVVASSSEVILASVRVEMGSSLRVGLNSEADPVLQRSKSHR